MVVNKIGDPIKKVAAAAAHELRGVLEVHPNMVHVVAREVQQLAYRPHLSSRALYNCIIFLNQLKLVKEEGDSNLNDTENRKDLETREKSSGTISLSISLINTYFELFEVAVNKGKFATNKIEKDTSASAMKSRLLGALLTGVNRAHPYLPTKDKKMEQHVDSLYRIAHMSGPSICTQSLMLLFHLSVGSGSKPSLHKDLAESNITRKNRFYRALYSKVGDSAMFCGRQVTLFFNLTYKAMKNDKNYTRVVAFAKRLLFTTIHCSPSVVSGALFLLSEVSKFHPALQASAFMAFHSITYDPLKREPCTAFSTSSKTVKKVCDNTGNDVSSLWELALTLHHYHPTVSKFSSSICDISYNGDPLRDFTLTPFLDKFAFRNPKTLEKIGKHLKRGESIGERRNGLEAGIKSMSSIPINDPDFWKNQDYHASEREIFFRNFFVEREKRNAQKGNNVEMEISKIDTGRDSENKQVHLDWDTDPEEEEFVQSLAEKLIESSGGGKTNLEDEDPNMEDWSDFDDEIDSNQRISTFHRISSGEEQGAVDSPSLEESLSLPKDEEYSEYTDSRVPFSGSKVGLEGTESGSDEGEQSVSQKRKISNSTFVDASEYKDIIGNSLFEKASGKRSCQLSMQMLSKNHFQISKKDKK